MISLSPSLLEDFSRVAGMLREGGDSILVACDLLEEQFRLIELAKEIKVNWRCRHYWATQFENPQLIDLRYFDRFHYREWNSYLHKVSYVNSTD